MAVIAAVGEARGSARYKAGRQRQVRARWQGAGRWGETMARPTGSAGMVMLMNGEMPRQRQARCVSHQSRKP